MSKLFKDLKPFAHNNRNVFDLTRTSTFSSKSGMIQPCFVQETVPDGKYKIDVAGIIRTLPMQQANFTTLKTNMEFFYVPYSQLWHYFNQFYYGRGDQHRTPSASITLDSQPLYVPTFHYRSVCISLVEGGLAQMYLEYFQDYLKWLDSVSLADITAGENVSEADVQTLFSRYRNNLQLFVDNLIKDYFNSESFTDLANIQENPMIDIHGRICAVDMIRTFDMLGYGNLLPFVKTYWSFIYEYYSLASIFETTFSVSIPEGESDPVMIIANSDGHFTDPYCAAYSVLVRDDYGLNGVYDWGDLSTDVANASTTVYGNVHAAVIGSTHALPLTDFVPDVAVNPLRIMAFFKIWNDFYRNSQYDNLPYHNLFNADYLNGQGSAKNFDVQRVLRMLLPNYHQYKKDKFTGSYPDSQFGDVAVAGLNNPTSLSAIVPEGASNYYGSSVAPDINGSNVVPGDTHKLLISYSGVRGYDFNINSGVSVLAIRQAEALQRWKEKILRAGNREKDLQDAIFGVKSKYIEDGYVDFLGSCDGTINVNPVAATASTSEAEIGELGAFAVGQIGSDTISYDSKDFGVIIGVLYVMPETKYDAFGLDPFNTKVEPDDYYKPDFQNLGLSPVFSSDFNIFNEIESQGGVQQSNIYVLGYLSRYHEYKTTINKVHGEFYGCNPFLQSLNPNGVVGSKLNQSDFPFQHALDVCASGSNSSWVSVRDVRDFSGMTLAALYCSPNDVDSLFYQQSDGGQYSDQFQYECQFTCKAILPMSVEGLPY